MTTETPSNPANGLGVGGGTVAFRLLVCGGRTYSEERALAWELSRWAMRHDGLEIITGYDPDNVRFQGADQLAHEWALANGIPAFPFPAPWRIKGNYAGPFRNQRMLDFGKPHGVVAFPGGRGTADMCARAEKAGIKPFRVPTPPEAS